MEKERGQMALFQILLRYNVPTYCNNMLYWWFYHGKLPTGVEVENFTRENKR